MCKSALVFIPLRAYFNFNGNLLGANQTKILSHTYQKQIIHYMLKKRKKEEDSRKKSEGETNIAS